MLRALLINMDGNKLSEGESVEAKKQPIRQL